MPDLAIRIKLKIFQASTSEGYGNPGIHLKEGLFKTVAFTVMKDFNLNKTLVAVL